MKPGLELDLLIAEQVMGEIVVKNKSGSKGGGFYYTIGEPHWFDIGGEMLLQNPIPDYSTDISAAWQVVENMQDAGWGFTIDCQKRDNWVASFAAEKPAESMSASHAICVAALRALRIGMEDDAR